MYEARANVKRILKLIIRKEQEINLWLHNLPLLTTKVHSRDNKSTRSADLPEQN